MSTDMQRYSLENQSDAIAVYAALHGLTVVRTYEDAGRSGVRIEGRDGLKRLIADVTSGRADFSVILVYDVSRWGRFQDSDEAAYYEFICKEAGVTVEYCAEQFENNGGLSATIVKNLKRAMAAEYSRELSVKVRAGQNRLAVLGFWHGSQPGYGLRRCLVDASGQRKGELAKGQWKSITTDRVILVPGPEHEVETVKRVYRLFVEERLTLRRIAATLNGEGIWNAQGRPWLATGVRELLSNEKYVGNNVLNMTSSPLDAPWRKNPRSQWLRAKGAFEPIVPRELFDRAQKRLDLNRRLTANELLDSLTAIWCRHGTISIELLKISKHAPSLGTYNRCFGGMLNAYALLGFVKQRIKIWTKNNRFRERMSDAIIEGAKLRGGVARPMQGNCMFRMNEELSLSTSIVRSATARSGQKRWNFGYKTQARPDLLLVARVTDASETLRDYFCIPYLLIGRNWLTFADGKTARFEPFRLPSLTALLDLFAREPIRPARASGRFRPYDGYDGAGLATWAAWPAPPPQEAIAGVIGRLRRMLANHELAELVCAQGLGTMPVILAAPDAYQSSGYGRCILDFAIVWGFVSRLMAHRDVMDCLRAHWPTFAPDMKMTYLSVLTKGPFARPPSAVAFAEDRDPA